MSSQEFRIENLHDGEWIAGKQPLFTTLGEAQRFLETIQGGRKPPREGFRIAMREIGAWTPV